MSALHNPFVYRIFPIHWVLGWLWAKMVQFAEQYDDLNDWEDDE